MNHAFAIQYRRGPAWVDRKTIFEQPLQAHLDYMHRLTLAGTVKLAGPFTDDRGGLVVVQTANAEAAQAIIDADPAVRDRLMVAEAHPWKLMAGSL